MKYRFLCSLFSIAIALTVFSSCAKRHERVEIPDNEATSIELSKIELELDRIESIAYSMGYRNSFHKLPVIVTSDRSVTAFGLCQFDSDNNGVYIVLHRKVLEMDVRNPRHNYTFSTLLHEIGHCYFKREHEATVVSKEGFIIEIDLFDSTGGESHAFREFPVSVMYTKDESEGHPVIGLGVSDIEEYFVAEILGKHRLTSFDELDNFSGVRVVPWTHPEE